MGKLELEMLPNTRDLGGIKAKDGRVIKENMLIRSGALYGLSESDLDVLKSHNLSLVVDLRTGLERNSRPDPVIDGVENAHLMLLMESKMGITKETPTLVDMIIQRIRQYKMTNKEFTGLVSSVYFDMLDSEFSKMQLFKFIDLLINNRRRGATLWHCSAGKDRAGVVTLLLLEILGVDRDTIIEDYMMTNTYCKDEIEQGVKYILVTTGNKDAGEMMYSVLASRKIYIDNLYYEIERKYKTFDNYLRDAYGITEEKKAYIRNAFLN